MDHSKLDEIIKKRGKEASATIPIPILQDIQNQFRYVPLDALKYVSDKTGIPATGLFGVATFYSQFRLSPVGRHMIKVCHGTACHVAGAVGISESLYEHLDVAEGGTTEDNNFTLDSVACLGCCSLAPVIMIDDTTYGKLNRTKAPRAVDTHLKNCQCEGAKNMLEDVIPASFKRGSHELPALASARQAYDRGNDIVEVVIGLGSCGIASGAEDIHKLFNAAVKEYKLPVKITIAGCMGLCHKEPMIELKDRSGKSFMYAGLDLAKTKKILIDHIGQGKPHPEWMIDVEKRDSSEGEYFAKQKRIVLENCGRIDPESIEEYINAGGYTAIAKAIKMAPDAIIEDVTKSGLRGRGGAGFSTGTKWKFARAAKGDQKWVVMLVGGNSIWANLFASVVGAFMYFATLTEVPILQGLIGSGMGKGPALALLLAGPALSLPSMIVIRSIIGTKKTVVYVSLVIVMATITGIFYGMIA